MAQATSTLGSDYARALADKDADRVRELLHPEIDFKAVTPRKAWEANDADGVLSVLFENWFGDTCEIRTLDRVESDAFADRERIGYRFSATKPEGDFVVEQQAYLGEQDGRICWMMVACSGFRPV
jgi:hypothetical protein